MNIQMERCVRQGMWEGFQSFYNLCGGATLPALFHLHKPRGSSKSVFWGFYGGFIALL